jgi:bacteriocin biosynthesis cyclodehydratase domain-containing protein
MDGQDVRHLAIPMDRVLRFKPHLRVEPAGDELVFLIGEHERFLLRGRLYSLVVPLLDGKRTEWEIMQALGDQVSPAEVYYIITKLERMGYALEARDTLSPEAAAFWYSLGVDAATAAGRLAATPVAVSALDQGLGELVEPLTRALAGMGVAVQGDAAVRLVLVGDYLDRALETVNRHALDQGFRWMPIRPGGATPWMGPLFRPGQGPCWACLAQRLRANRPVESFVARRAGRSASLALPPAMLPTSARAALDLGALALARWIVDGGRGAIDGNLLALDMGRIALAEHPVVRRPQCPACGDPDLLATRAAKPVVLRPRPKHFTDDGGWRCMAPDDTYSRLEHLISPITGVVARLGPVPGRDHALRPVYGASYFASPPPDRVPEFDEFCRSSMGKGRTAAQSRTGALCEAIERYSASFQGDERRIRARVSDLGEDAVSPHALLGYSASQYERREQLNQGEKDYRRWIPRPFDEQRVIDWTPVWSLTHERRRWLPAAYCYFHMPAPPEEHVCHPDSNGHAAGNCLEEAILQGLLELAERDAVGVWWYNRLRRPAVDLAGFEQPYFEALEAHYRSLGYRLWVLDVTNDLDIPVFVAVAHDPDAGRYRLGLGAHLDARMGVQRALTELNQVFDPTDPSPAPWGKAELEDTAFLRPDDALVRHRNDFADIWHHDLRGDVYACVDRAARVGLETLVLDQTRPDIGLHVAKVVVPGLRHFWPRFAPGRLYEVPVRLGWLERPRAEAELNPVPLYL